MLAPRRPSSTTLASAALALAAACGPVYRPGLPPEPPRGAVWIDASELGECERRFNRPAPWADEAAQDPALASILADVPKEVRRVVRAAGLERLLAEYMDTAALERPDAPLALRVQMITRLSALEIEVASLLFETQCVGNQMEAAMRELDAHQRRREVGLTVTSILLGASAAAIGGIWDLTGPESRGPATLGIVGGISSAGLGIAAFSRERRAVVFPHQHNILAPIVDGADPTGLYPAFVFRLLMSPPPDGGSTPREEILEDWQKILRDVPAAHRPLAESVLYGGGGLYDAGLVSVRERMYDVLESHLNAVDSDLELLYRFITLLDPGFRAPRGP